MDKVLVAMSGGVDSSVAAWLLRESGASLIGAMMKLYEGGGDNGCCSVSDALDARAVAARLGMEFHVFDFSRHFADQVIAPFVRSYQTGCTPNPCIDCNRYLKFERFLQRATEIDYTHIATGHYARIEHAHGRYLLKKGVDADKDQSYVLYAMTQDQLRRTRLPLGALTKTQVRQIAEEQGFVNAKKRESQDICFVPDGDYAGFIRHHTGSEPPAGLFVDTAGNILGEHKGIVHYTIGQRKGLGLSAATPLYVCALNTENNTVVVGADDDLYGKSLIARDINLIPLDALDAPMRVRAKIRYRHPEQSAVVWQLDNDTLKLEFDSPQRAITKGQAVVLYDGDIVIGGGTIA